jgi:hypothetical protein
MRILLGIIIRNAGQRTAVCGLWNMMSIWDVLFFGILKIGYQDVWLQSIGNIHSFLFILAIIQISYLICAVLKSESYRRLVLRKKILLKEMEFGNYRTKLRKRSLHRHFFVLMTRVWKSMRIGFAKYWWQVDRRLSLKLQTSGTPH